MQHNSPDEIGQLRDAVSRLAHELAEALTAANGYLQASQGLADRSDPASLGRLREAIGKAIEQSKRAGEIVAKLRSVASP